MKAPYRYSLTDADKDAVIRDQMALIERQAARIAELEAALKTPKKTSSNSHTPPSQDGPGRKSRKDDKAEGQRRRHRYDHIELPEIRPIKPTGSPFGPGIWSLLLYLHHGHHVSFERLAGLSRDLFGLKISEGAITNIFQATAKAMEKARAAIREKVMKAQVIASDETTTRIDGVTHGHWVFLSKDAVLHDIAPQRAKSVAETVLDGHRPEVWVSDRYAGQQDLAQAHQVCLAPVLRDVQYAIDCGDSVFSPRIRDHLRWAIRVGKRQETLRDSTLRSYAAKALIGDWIAS